MMSIMWNCPFNFSMLETCICSSEWVCLQEADGGTSADQGQAHTRTPKQFQTLYLQINLKIGNYSYIRVFSNLTMSYLLQLVSKLKFFM